MVGNGRPGPRTGDSPETMGSSRFGSSIGILRHHEVQMIQIVRVIAIARQAQRFTSCHLQADALDADAQHGQCRE